MFLGIVSEEERKLFVNLNISYEVFVPLILDGWKQLLMGFFVGPFIKNPPNVTGSFFFVGKLDSYFLNFIFNKD